MEMIKLIKLLKESEIPFESDIDGFGSVQVFYPNIDNPICDVICNAYSFGGDRGLLEMMGLVEDEDGDSVEGHLWAEEVFERIKEHYEKVFTK